MATADRARNRHLCTHVHSEGRVFSGVSSWLLMLRSTTAWQGAHLILGMSGKNSPYHSPESGLKSFSSQVSGELQVFWSDAAWDNACTYAVVISTVSNGTGASWYRSVLESS